MEKFLDFLAGNYIYFLIAAGILFFALIGFIVDLRKRNKSEEEDSVTPEVTVPVEPIQENVEINDVPVNPVPTVPTEEFNPAPPMPEFELDSTPVVPTEVNVAPVEIEPEVKPEQEQPRIEIEELK